MLNKAYLIIDDLKLVIIDYSMEINKHIVYNNSYPSKKGQHRGFNLTVEAPQSNLLWEEAIKNYSMTPLMQIRFEPAILGSEKTRIISMYDCHVVYCRTSFNSTDNQPITDTVHITCGGVEDSYYPSTVYEEHWRVTYPNNGGETVVDNDDEPELLGHQIEDSNNQIIEEDKVLKNQEIFLVINSKNADGQIVDIDLTNKSVDYEYNGKWMENDIIRDITLLGETTKIKLKAVKQKS